MGNLSPSDGKSKIIMTGIDSAVDEIPLLIGKEDVTETYGLLGLPVLSFEYKNLLINTWPRNRLTDKEYINIAANKSYYEGNAGIIFAVNAESLELLDYDGEYQRHMLEDMMIDAKFNGIPILVIAYKQEKIQAVKGEDIKEKWALGKIFKERKWNICEAKSKSEEEVRKGLDWLAEQIPKID